MNTILNQIKVKRGLGPATGGLASENEHPGEHTLDKCCILFYFILFK